MSTLEQRLADARAHFKSILFLAGAHMWTHEEAVAHLYGEVAKQYDGSTRLSRFNLRFPRLSEFLYIGPYPTWNTSPLEIYKADKTGEIMCRYIRTTHRGRINEILPPDVAATVKRILDMAPATVFEVSFIGFDPVLWAVPDASKSAPNVLSDYAEPVHIWVGHGKNAKTILPPR